MKYFGDIGDYLLASACLASAAHIVQSPEPLEDHGMNVKKTACSMIAAFKLAVNIPTIPKEFPGGPSPRPVRDSILSLLLARRDEPGLSTLFPLLAASIVASLLFGAASSLEVGR